MKRIPIEQARADFDALVESFCTIKEPLVIERDGKQVAVLLDPEAYERYHTYVMDQFRKTIEEIQQANAHEDPDEVYRIVTEVVEEVRREQYEREQSQQAAQRR